MSTYLRMHYFRQVLVKNNRVSEWLNLKLPHRLLVNKFEMLCVPMLVLVDSNHMSSLKESFYIMIQPSGAPIILDVK